jgi:hypothetical protein
MMFAVATFPATSNSFARSLSWVLKDKLPTNTLVLTILYIYQNKDGAMGAAFSKDA